MFIKNLLKIFKINFIINKYNLKKKKLNK